VVAVSLVIQSIVRERLTKMPDQGLPADFKERLRRCQAVSIETGAPATAENNGSHSNRFVRSQSFAYFKNTP
jgi:hypothetical protein